MQVDCRAGNRCIDIYICDIVSKTILFYKVTNVCTKKIAQLLGPYTL